MGTRYHIKLDIEGALKNKSFSGFINDDGSKAHWKQVQKYFKQCLSEGKVYLPYGNCEGFDFKTGCPGHPIKEIENDRVHTESQ